MISKADFSSLNRPHPLTALVVLGMLLAANSQAEDTNAADNWTQFPWPGRTGACYW